MHPALSRTCVGAGSDNHVHSAIRTGNFGEAPTQRLAAIKTSESGPLRTPAHDRTDLSISLIRVKSLAPH